MHLKKVRFLPDKYPTRQHYPFNLPLFQTPQTLEFSARVCFFVGENGSGKSTLLEALARKCSIHIWQDTERARCDRNPYEELLYSCLEVEWADGMVPGSFFASQIFHHFSELLDEWAASDPGVLKYFGGQSLLTQSHGQSLMSFFRSRFQVKGLYLLDEPETALSARRQLELLQLLNHLSTDGNVQFIIATHSPILLACPHAVIYSFDQTTIQPIEYEQTDHYQIYKNFLNHRDMYLSTEDCYFMPIQIITESQISSKLDADIKQLLCTCFPKDQAVFSRTRAWNGNQPVWTFYMQEEDRIIGHLSFSDQHVRAGNESCHVAGVQNVCVRTEYRGRGLSGQLSEAALQKGRELQYDFGMLFTSQLLVKLYAAAGWQPVTANRLLQLDDTGREVPIPDNQIPMYYPLVRREFPCGTIRLQTRIW